MEDDFELPLLLALTSKQLLGKGLQFLGLGGKWWIVRNSISYPTAKKVQSSNVKSRCYYSWEKPSYVFWHHTYFVILPFYFYLTFFPWIDIALVFSPYDLDFFLPILDILNCFFFCALLKLLKKKVSGCKYLFASVGLKNALWFISALICPGMSIYVPCFSVLMNTGFPVFSWLNALLKQTC